MTLHSSRSLVEFQLTYHTLAGYHPKGLVRGRDLPEVDQRSRLEEMEGE